jgi:DNA-binding MarR family transcriptional regulator
MKLEEEIIQKKFKSSSQKLAINIIYTHNWLVNQNAQLFKNKDITPQQFNILRILKGQYPKSATVKLLRERMLDKMSDASRLVEKLRTKGLVSRLENSADRRNVDVQITAKGIDLLASLSEIDIYYDQKFKTLSQDEINTLNHLLDKLRG